MVLDSSRTINGSYGAVYHEGQWLTNIKSAEAMVEINKEEIPLSGTRWMGHKVTSLTGSGSMTGYKVTSDFIKLVGAAAYDDKKPYVTELIMKLNDPAAFGAERVRLKAVQFDRIPLGSFELNAIVEEELPFTFSGFDLLDAIKQS
ncbi:MULTISPECIES: phage tail tube protein [Peribacillus]|uniref:phage tail tube protein n=1 Tax=Peribacillus TaxID=2675229 RepID=UPI001F4EBD9E|nr:MULTISPECIES: phage tail tube protein [unclassified Peribacillus]MCK1985167.1 phage tail tube protein [Peribacillus sp. Aquil_B1]MCK2007183.1 phage tail tube protein [Peribacillus sp. Aquil_B8]